MAARTSLVVGGGAVAGALAVAALLWRPAAQVDLGGSSGPVPGPQQLPGIQPPTTESPDPLGHREAGAPVTPERPRTQEGPKGAVAPTGAARQPRLAKVGALLERLQQAVDVADPARVEQIVRDLLAAGKDGLPDLVDTLLASRHRGLRERLIDALVSMNVPESLDALKTLALQSLDDVEIRKRATQALGGMSLPGTAEALVAVYDQGAGGDRGIHGPIRAEALQALARQGSKFATDTLGRALEGEEDPNVRRWAAYALGEGVHAESPGAVHRLERAMREDADETTRGFAATSLGKTADPRGRIVLQQYLESWPAEATRRTLYHALTLRPDATSAAAIRAAAWRESSPDLVKRAAGTLVTLLSDRDDEALQELTGLRRQHERVEELDIFLENLQRAVETRRAGRQPGGPIQPPAPPAPPGPRAPTPHGQRPK